MTFARGAATAALLLLAACRGGPSQLAPSPAVTAETEWSAVLARSAEEVAAKRHAAADRMLADFTTRFPASSEAVEAMYWRALHKLDPANGSGSAREAAVLLDGYLASANQSHRVEAAILRRVASASEPRGTGPAPGPARTDAPSRSDDRARDEEIGRLKEELAKVNAELERIKKRLSQPKS